MYGHILIGLDGSALAELALPFVTDLARATGATVTLVRAVAPATDTDGGSPRPATPGEAARYLLGLASRLTERLIRVAVAVPDETGAAGLVAEIDRRRPDLIVLTTHGRSGLGRTVYGGTVEAVLRAGRAPVLLLPSANGEDVRLTGRQRRVVLPLDGSPAAETAIPAAGDLARALDGTIVLVRSAAANSPAVPGLGLPASTGTACANGGHADADDYLHAVAARLTGEGLRTEVVVNNRPAASLIVAASRAPGTAAIVMASHGWTGLPRLTCGSVATEVLHRVDCPVLLTRPASVHRVEPASVGPDEQAAAAPARAAVASR